MTFFPVRRDQREAALIGFSHRGTEARRLGAGKGKDCDSPHSRSASLCLRASVRDPSGTAVIGFTLLFLLVSLTVCDIASAQLRGKKLFEDVGLDQRLDGQVPLELAFRDEAGKQVRLGDYFHDQPVILVLVQYRCPMLCTEVLNGFLKSSQAVKFQMGSDYQVVTVSIDPRETPQMASEKKRRYAGRYRREGAEQGWHFLTGEQKNIDALARSIGYGYRYDAASDQYAHPSGIVIATPTGRISRYFYGIEYHPSDLRLGLVESSENRIGSPVDQVLLLCFHYDPTTGKYGLVIASVLRLAALATVLALGGYLSFAFYREFRQSEVPSPKSKVGGLGGQHVANGQ